MALFWVIKCPDLDSNVSFPHPPSANQAAMSPPSAPSPPLITQLTCLPQACTLSKPLIAQSAKARRGVRGLLNGTEVMSQVRSTPFHAGCDLVCFWHRPPEEVLPWHWRDVSAQLLCP